MKIGIGTDNGEKVKPGLFENSLYFKILEFRNGEIVSDELRPNPHAVSGEPGRYLNKEKRVMKLLYDCGLFMGKQMDKSSAAEFSSENIDCIVTDMDDIDRAVFNYLYGRSDDFKYFSVNTGTFVPCSRRYPSLILNQ